MHAVSLLFHDVYVEDPHESGFRSAAADRYKLPLADFDAQLAGLARNPHPFRITVDDGGVSYYSLIADRLEAHGWRGHCFVTTAMIGQPGFLSAGQIRELDRRGHVVGSHSVSHPPRFNACTAGQMRREWCDSRAALEDLLGHEVKVASLPGGYYSRAVADAAGDAGLTVLFNSEPTTAVRTVAGLQVAGRYTIRRGDEGDTARRLVQPTPWTRCAAWAAWNAKAPFKPLLGGSYVRVADWILGAR